MALSVTILIVVVIGIMVISLALYSYFYVADASREATRYAIVRGADQPIDCSAPGPADCIAQAADVQAYVRGLGFPGIDPNRLNIATQWSPPNTGMSCSGDACKVPGNLVQVTASYTFPLSIPFISPQTLTMHSSSQMVISY